MTRVDRGWSLHSCISETAPSQRRSLTRGGRKTRSRRLTQLMQLLMSRDRAASAERRSSTIAAVHFYRHAYVLRRDAARVTPAPHTRPLINASDNLMTMYRRRER